MVPKCNKTLLGLTIPNHNLIFFPHVDYLCCSLVAFLHCSFTLFIHVVVVSYCWCIVYHVVDVNVIVGPSHYLCCS
jgi:hypothetical protein